MDRDQVETIELNDDYRLVVYVDEDAQCPREDWHMLTGFVKIRGRGDTRLTDVPAVYDFPADLVDADNRLSRVVWGYDRHLAEGYYRLIKGVDTEDLVARWAKIFYGTVVQYDAEHGGYWFCSAADPASYATPVDTFSRSLFRDNWPELAPGSPESLAKQAEVIDQEQATYREWADGEVYGVVLEQRSTWARLDEDGDADLETQRDEWEEVESIWGCYLDHDYTALVVAQEYFGVPSDPKEYEEWRHDGKSLTTE